MDAPFFNDALAIVFAVKELKTEKAQQLRTITSKANAMQVFRAMPA